MNAINILTMIFSFIQNNKLQCIVIFCIILIIKIFLNEREKRLRLKEFMSVEDFLRLPNEKISGCYVILIYNKPLSKKNLNYKHVYVGQSIDLYKRVKTHLNGNGCKRIYYDNKNGKYIYIKFFKSRPGTLDRLEKKLIKKYKAYNSKKGYNKTRGGGGYYGNFFRIIFKGHKR